MLSFEPYVLIVHILSFELFLFPRMLCRRDVMSTIIPHSIRYAQNASGSQEMLQSYLLEKQRDNQPDVFHTQNRLAMWDVEAGASVFEYHKHYGLFNCLSVQYARVSIICQNVPIEAPFIANLGIPNAWLYDTDGYDKCDWGGEVIEIVQQKNYIYFFGFVFIFSKKDTKM